MADKRISEFLDGGLVQTGDEIAAVRGTDNYKVRVGSAAAYDAGQSGGDLVVLEEDSSGTVMLPAVSGANLTDIPAQTDPTVQVSADDTTSGYLEEKITAGSNVTINKITDSAGIESLEISASGGGGSGSVLLTDIEPIPANTLLGNPTGSADGVQAMDAAAARSNLGLGSAAQAPLVDDDTFATALPTNVPSAGSVKAYVDANVVGFGVGQDWSAQTRTSGTYYQNTTGKPIAVSASITRASAGTTSFSAVCGDSGSTTNEICALSFPGSGTQTTFFVVPNNFYYRLTYSGHTAIVIKELR